MKNLHLIFLLLIVNLLPYFSVAQIKGIFDKEEPIFNATILPTDEEGAVLLVFYFTHSKASSIEASVWLKDQGTSLSGEGSPRLVRGLQEINNRQQDTVLIRGLQKQHFYTIGLDYKTSKLLSSKFESKVLRQGYRYEWEAPKETPAKDENPAESARNSPCQNPDLFVQIEPNGYCGEENRPAVLVQCMNCQGKKWEFNVEYRTASGTWESLKADGKPQPAFGNAIRTEPLCNMLAGAYFVRVIARSEHCATAITHNISSKILIEEEGKQAKEADFTTKGVFSDETAKEAQFLPDTCAVVAKATIAGNVIQGVVELALGSPCGNFSPYAEIFYVHPGYRDIAVKPISLIPGAKVPFEIKLDEKDIARGIHTLRIVAHTRLEAAGQGVPMSAFWLKATEKGKEMPSMPKPLAEDNPIKAYGNPPMEVLVASEQTVKEPDFEEPAFTEEIATVNVKASDPNCNQIQDLSLVHLSGQPEKPLYISWMNPRCCQEDGCKYSIWAGQNPDKLRVIVEGSKKGAFIKEILQDLSPADQYIEIAVKTSNGNRKAAYVLGEGPKYGIEAIMDYRDGLKPQKSDPVVMQKEVSIATPNPDAGMLSASAATLGGDLAARGVPNTFSYVLPKRAITEFSPCKYEREIAFTGDNPAKVGSKVLLQYNFSDKDYRYTLYFQPENSEEWVIAPGTKEQQPSAVFDMNITPFHAGKYMVLAQKVASGWGCLALPLEKAIEIKVTE